jgi:hypothetical protein
MMDTLIPASADGRMPGASEAGAAEWVARAIERAPERRALVSRGVRLADDLAREQSGRCFADLEAPARKEVVEALGAKDPDAFRELLTLVARGYYQHPRVLAGIGLEPRPPHPEGYAVEPTDFALLDGVRRGGRRYREV